MPVRVIAYIDGWNLYLAMREHREIGRSNCWVNYRKLMEIILEEQSSGAALVAVKYFSTVMPYTSSKRHRDFVEAQEAMFPNRFFFYRGEKGCAIMRCSRCKKELEQFLCPHCREPLKKHQEKQTDVKLALQIYADALKTRGDENHYDHALLVTNDRDLIPAAEFVSGVGKEIWRLSPPVEKEPSRWKCVNREIPITPRHIMDAQLPALIDTGRETIDIQRYRDSYEDIY